MKDKTYTEEEAFKLIRKEQVAILKDRKVIFNSKSAEADLVKLILDSNPVKEVMSDGKEPKPGFSKDEIPKKVKEPIVEISIDSKQLKHFKQFDSTLTEEDITCTGGGESGKDYFCKKIMKGMTMR